MNTQPSSTVPVPVLHCAYTDCGNEWVPRTTHMPKVCPKCKRYGWQTGATDKKTNNHKPKGGKKHVKKTADLGPETEKFLKQHNKI